MWIRSVTAHAFGDLLKLAFPLPLAQLLALDFLLRFLFLADLLDLVAGRGLLRLLRVEGEASLKPTLLAHLLPSPLWDAEVGRTELCIRPVRA